MDEMKSIKNYICEHIFQFINRQLPVRVGIHGPQARLNYEQTMTCLIEISRYKFSLILAGLTKALQRTSESVSCFLLSIV